MNREGKVLSMGRAVPLEQRSPFLVIFLLFSLWATPAIGVSSKKYELQKSEPALSAATQIINGTLAQGNAQGNQELEQLQPNQTIETYIAGGEFHYYEIAVNAGQYLKVVLEQKGIDLVLDLFSPNGRKLAEIDNTSAGGLESFRLIAEVSGKYRIELRPYDKIASKGDYTIAIEALRSPTSEDRKGLAALAAYEEGWQLYRQQTAEGFQAAIQKWSEGLELYRQLGDRSGEANMLKLIGFVYSSLGQKQEALGYYKEGLVIAKDIDDRSLAATLLNNIGNVYSALGELESALEYLEESAPLLREVGARDREAMTLTNIGTTYDRLGEYQQAIDFFNKSESLWQELGNSSGLATTLNNMASTYRSLGATEQALDYFNQSLSLLREVGDRRREAATLSNIANIHSNQGNREQALEEYEQSLALIQQLGDTLEEATILNNIGTIYSDWQKHYRALSYYNQALAIREDLGDRYGSALNFNNIGNVYFNLGELEKALDYYQRGLSITSSLGDRSLEANSRYSIAKLLSDRGKLEEALVQMETAIEIIEDLRDNVSSDRLRTSYFATVQDYYELYIDLLMQLHKNKPSAGFDALALQTSERARARSLLELLAAAKADIRQGVDPELLSQERSLQRELDAIEQRRILAFRNNGNPELKAAIEAERQKLLEQYRQVQGSIKAKSPRYAALTQPQPLTLDQIQEKVLDKETLLLEYFLGSKRSYLWAVTDSEIRTYELPGREEIEKVARTFRNAVTSPRGRVSPKQVAKAAAALSELILAPVAEMLGEKRLLIVSDGALQYIPFAAIAVPGTTRENSKLLPLAVNHEIVTLPSASTIGILREELADRPEQPKNLAVIADPVFGAEDERLIDSSETASSETASSQTENIPVELERAAIANEISLKRLPFTREEAQQILALVPENSSIQAFGFEASRAIATSRELGQYRMIHIATHGILNSTNPELSGLVMSLVDENGLPQNGFLRLHEIYNLDLPADLVVLSACQTGLGQEVRGEGLVGLTRGFMYAGAARVVVSLWNVDDAATAELMVNFYRGMLSDELSPGSALRAAQIKMWEQKQWSAPYYWAAFTLQGEWR